MTLNFKSKNPGVFKQLLSLGLGGAMLLATGCGGEAEPSAAEPSAQQAQPLSGWVQIWSDEFNGTSVDQSNWSYITNVHVNNEQQQYTNSAQNISVSGGTLKITARLQSNNGYPFTSGRLESAGKRQFGHTRIESRIKMPVGAGLWPAFWLLGNDINTVGWPACGELDIRENVGYSDWVSGALHGPG